MYQNHSKNAIGCLGKSVEESNMCVAAWSVAGLGTCYTVTLAAHMLQAHGQKNGQTRTKKANMVKPISAEIGSLGTWTAQHFCLCERWIV
jgi:hypothetical protein